MSVYVIAEVGVNHNGSLDLALKLVDAAAESGCDAVKFQTFTSEKLVTRSAGRAEYQKRNLGTQDDSQLDMLKSLELSTDDFKIIRQRCLARGIEFISTPFDEDSVDMLEGLGMMRYKISSGDLTNKPLLEKIARVNKPMILSTGMATLEEIGEAISWVRACGNDDITLLHCTSNYPTSYEDVNMRAMDTLSEKFGLPVGYSDHTIGIEIAIMAVARGARVIEKHITLDHAMKGPDHRASLEVLELPSLVQGIRHVEVAFGTGEKRPVASEGDTARVARKSVVVTRDMHAGQALSTEDITIKRPGTGIPPKYFHDVAGRVLSRDVAGDTPLSWDDLK